MPLSPSKPAHHRKRLQQGCRILLTAILGVLFASGCATVPKNELAELQDLHIPLPLYRKILHGSPLTRGDLVVLSHRHVSRGAMIYFIYHSRTYIPLTAEEILALEKQGVSGDILTFVSENRPENVLQLFLET